MLRCHVAGVLEQCAGGLMNLSGVRRCCHAVSRVVIT
jgi:hypothetical protein